MTYFYAATLRKQFFPSIDLYQTPPYGAQYENESKKTIEIAVKF